VTDNVVSLRGEGVASARRASFLQAVAESFDLYVKDHGCEPDGLVYVMAGIRQTSQIGWHIEGESEGGATSVIALAAVHCLREAGK
jgi:hypothetical protein